VDLYTQASKSALEFPELAPGMTPLEGILVPTLGAFYLASTLLLPLIAIRAIARDKETGGLKLLLQMPFTPAWLVTIKVAGYRHCDDSVVSASSLVHSDLALPGRPCTHAGAS